MRSAVTKVLGLSFIGLAASVFVAGNAHAVAGFTRQTGMNCNSCHTLHGAPTPNFTFTGKKFKAMGYRLPGGPGHTQERTQEQGKPDDLGEFLSILPTTVSGRFQYTAADVSKPSGGDWGDVSTNPTSRLAFFPFTGPIGNNFGIWTEWYIVPFTSADGEWGIADTSYEEFDFRYIINPGNKDHTIGIAMTNQSINELFGFGPFPGLPSFVSRGGVGGYSHPNRVQVYTYGWAHDRFVWALGIDSGDTNYNWAKTNTAGVLGYAIRNRNDNEMWINLTARTGGDALPLVSASGSDRTTRSWQYRDAIGGITATRGVGCPGMVAGRRPAGSCAYIAEELDDHTSINLEWRWGGQNVDKFLGERMAGSWSLELVARVTTNEDEYIDGAGAKRDTWGISPVLGWKHTYYFKPLLSGDMKYDFTDRLGNTYDIDTKPTWNFSVAYKPVENFLLYLQYANNQSNTLTGPATTGKSLSITADISF